MLLKNRPRVFPELKDSPVVVDPEVVPDTEVQPKLHLTTGILGISPAILMVSDLVLVHFMVRIKMKQREKTELKYQGGPG